MGVRLKGRHCQVFASCWLLSACASAPLPPSEAVTRPAPDAATGGAVQAAEPGPSTVLQASDPDAMPPSSHTSAPTADASASLTRSPPDAGAAQAVVAIRPVADPAACNQRMLDPTCFDAFPAEVRCPANKAEVPEGAVCGLLGQTKAPRECTYPTGSCACQHTPYCGGAYPTMIQQSGMHWRCRPPRSPRDCPDSAADGRRCSIADQQCSYGGCGNTTRCVCVGGKFKCRSEHWAPPP